ncbi:ATP-binding cassette domain-containing protein [Microbacterium suwonense]|uniref:ABC transporter domain-containing protein n=1 Tax=Microbacterium suwonense TaxID=683047 RepID=A0ABM8FX25_9MICO|nr:ATP-binding cassette domain-containing protein [Microbacterium suwonense]BDZ40254.1 hypothetical protein GCM10025863_28680 [Microbacterium suwonense]
MPGGQVLEFNRATKRFGDVTAVADLSVRVEPGVVTGFLGPNGAGKTTSLRMLLGQIRPTSGTATIGGSAYSELRNPLRTVGAVLEEAAYRPRRTATRQLLIAAKANGIPTSRVDEVLRMVGLQDDADTRLGSYSLGMRQRLAVASALLGDPGALVLDEPANGLDPEGIRWMRLLMRRLADEGRTVLVSSHVLSEIEQVADNVVVLSKGRAVFSGPIDQLADPSGGAVIVDAANRAPLITALSAAKLNFDVLRSGVTVRGSDAATVGAITTAAGVPLTLLQQRGPSLEDVFLDLVYGRRSDSPRLDKVANPVAHAPLVADGSSAGAASAAGIATAGAAAMFAGESAADADGTVDAEPADADETAAADTDAATEPANADAEPDVATDAEAGASDDEPAVEEPLAEESADSDSATETQRSGPGEEPQEATGEVETSEGPADSAGDAAPAEHDDGTAPGEDPHENAASGEESPDTGTVLPQATEAVSLPSFSSTTTFTELITGIPASASPDDSEPTAPATEAISVFAPLLPNEDDDDSAVDDAEDDPRLAAMRTSLSSAASRFFEGPAPDYPYGHTPASDSEQDQPEQDDQSTDAPDAESADTHPDQGHDHDGDQGDQRLD